MNVNSLKSKKSLKIITLLVSSMLIATASATIYNYLNLSAGVGVEGLTLAWDNTDLDTGVSATIAGATCTLNGLMGPAGGTRTYSNAIKLTSTAATTFDIEVVSVTTTGGAGIDNLDSIVVNIYDENGDPQGTPLTVFSGGSAGSTPVTGLSMTGAVTWTLEWVITWKTTAVAGTDTVTVTLKVTTPTVT
jgi:hypothetical protein